MGKITVKQSIMRTFSLAAILAAANAINLEVSVQERGIDIETDFGDVLSGIMAEYDDDADGALEGDEFVRLAEHLNYDGELTSEQMGAVLMEHQAYINGEVDGDEVSEWFVNSLLSTSGTDYMISESEFIAFTDKLGINQEAAYDAFNSNDTDGNGELSVTEQV